MPTPTLHAEAETETNKGCAQQGDARGLWNWVSRGQCGCIDDARYYRGAWRLPLVSPAFRGR